ncbi:hypothetical protein [Fundidesulfovibrio terrae]|uniref:hypothetical protein n=1 Tax=Fundidesulfovibrio terrae TaxID=2922866 RepID=UPI001FAFC7E5|nr:hypothetical protein [Fundidesulfovibrio terrae]
MSQDDATARIDTYLPVLRRLKETSARREVMEREILLSVLLANRDRIAEAPVPEGDQQALVNVVSSLSQPYPAHAHYQDWMSQFLAALNQYEVAQRTGAKDQTATLLDQLSNMEALLAKCLQGYIILSGVVRDEFNDVILARFGEAALSDIDELSHAGVSNDHYWKELLERFAFGFVNKAYAEMLEKQHFKMSREGAFIAVRFPLDAILEQMPGTDKTIDKTRLQASFEAGRQDPLASRAAAAVAQILAGMQKPMLSPKSSRHDFELLGAVAAMDPAMSAFVDVFVDGKPMEDDASEADADTSERGPERRAARLSARKEFLKAQLVAMAAGAALAMGVLREDLGRALQNFTAKEQEKLLQVAGAFDPDALALAHTLMLEYALCRLMTGKIEDEGGKVQVKCFKQHRASRRDVEALAGKGFNRIRQKVFFDEDPASPDRLLFKAKSGQDLAETLRMSNIEPALAHAVSGLWTKMDFKAEAVALINLTMVAKATQNVQAKVGEILAKLGVVKTAQP